MKTTLIASGLSLALHLLVWVVLARKDAVVAPEKAVQFEVMRTGLISAPQKVTAMPAAPAPAKRAPVHPESSRGAGEPRTPPVHPQSRKETGEPREPPVHPESSRGTGEPQTPPAHPESSRGTGEPQTAEATEPVGAGLDTSALSRRLQQVAQRCYPAAARRFRQTGEAQLQFCLDGGGALREATVIRSSGFELLDHAATGCVVPGAAPFGPETFGRCFTVPVRFNP